MALDSRILASIDKRREISKAGGDQCACRHVDLVYMRLGKKMPASALVKHYADLSQSRTRIFESQGHPP